jgi:uncharacterized protein
MNDTPPPDDAADDLEALYRRSSAQDLSRPSAKTREAILEHSLRLATNRAQMRSTDWSIQSESSPALGQIAPVTRFSRPKWQRPVLVGSLAAAALAGLLIGPQYLRPAAPPVTLQISAKSAVSEQKRFEATPASGPTVAEKSESAPAVMNLPATVPAPRFRAPARLAAPRAGTAESATTARAASGASNPGVMGGISAASTDASEQVSVTGMRIQRTPGAPAAAAAAQSSRDARTGDSSTPEKPPDAASPLDIRDTDGRTALMLAVLQGRLDAVMDLLRRGADPNAADNSGVTPLQAARAKNRPEIADALVHAGAR